MLTTELIKRGLVYAQPKNIEKYLLPLNETLIRFEINTPERVAAFLAQVGHESASLSAVEENLNYSAFNLKRVFKKYFPTEEEAEKYAHNPEKIANRVYANRMGNGPEESGDGWRYRGMGLIQLTGKENRVLVSSALGYDFITYSEDLMLPGAAALSAGWFWVSKNLNRLADLGTPEAFKQITKLINGGYNGLEDRINKWRACKAAFNILT